jgi:hypothetical protein
VLARTRPEVLNSKKENRHHHHLTPDQEYLIIGVHVNTLRLINDNGEPILYGKHLFNVTDYKIPPNWQFKEFAEADYYLQPSNVSAPGFYEDYFNSDGDLEAQDHARATLLNTLNEILAWSIGDDRIVIQRDLARLKPRHSVTPFRHH